MPSSNNLVFEEPHALEARLRVLLRIQTGPFRFHGHGVGNTGLEMHNRHRVETLVWNCKARLRGLNAVVIACLCELWKLLGEAFWETERPWDLEQDKCLCYANAEDRECPRVCYGKVN